MEMSIGPAVVGGAERETSGVSDNSKFCDDDVHVIVIGSATLVASGKLCRRLNFCVKCFHPTNRWEHMHKSRVSTNLGSSLCISCDGVSQACAAQCPQRLSSSQGKSHHRASGPWRKCHWGRWCSCTRRRHKGVVCNVCFLWNMTGILVTGAEHCFAPNMIGHETGSAPSSQCQTCHVARKRQPPHGQRGGIDFQMECASCAVASCSRR